MAHRIWHVTKHYLNENTKTEVQCRSKFPLLFSVVSSPYIQIVNQMIFLHLFFLSETLSDDQSTNYSIRSIYKYFLCFFFLLERAVPKAFWDEWSYATGFFLYLLTLLNIIKKQMMLHVVFQISQKQISIAAVVRKARSNIPMVCRTRQLYTCTCRSFGWERINRGTVS